MAAESFKTEIDSMSFGFKFANSLSEIEIPSMTINGFILLDIELIPRIKILPFDNVSYFICASVISPFHDNNLYLTELFRSVSFSDIWSNPKSAFSSS